MNLDDVRALSAMPSSNPGKQVPYERLNMADSTGFGSYQESDVIIPCLLNDDPPNYTAMVFLDDEPPISDRMTRDSSKRGAHSRKTSINLKIIPCVTGDQRIAELVTCNLEDISTQFDYSGPARLHLIPHINAPIADLTVLGVVEGRHFKADSTLPYGRIVHDYLA